MSVKVTGLGIVSSLGLGVKEHEDALRHGLYGLKLPVYLNTIHHVPVGEVPYDLSDLKKMLSIRENKTVTRTALLGMVAAREAVSDSRLDVGKQRIGIISGTSVGGMDMTSAFYKDYLVNPGRGRISNVLGHDCFDSTFRIAQDSGLTGYSTTISTACSSAANAIMTGCRMIEAGILDCVLVGGTDALSLFTLNGFKSLMILDDELCRPFDKSRKGLNLGEGAAYLMLERDSLRDEVKGYGYVKGWANTNDAFHQTASSENGEGAFLAMSKALTRAGMINTKPDYINAHGTGTPNNDSSEVKAMERLWGEDIPMYSSTKSFTGHALGAAGAIEAVISFLSIKNGMIWPSLRFNQSDDDVISTPQTVLNVYSGLKCVMSNSFGFGGNCTSLIFSVDK